MRSSEKHQADVHIWRDADGTLLANVPHLVHHSPSGFECGYCGSGPADLALSIIGVFVPASADGSGVRLYKGQVCSRFAWAHHQAFKFEVIARLPRDGGTIRAADIHRWIADRAVDITEEH